MIAALSECNRKQAELSSKGQELLKIKTIVFKKKIYQNFISISTSCYKDMVIIAWYYYYNPSFSLRHKIHIYSCKFKHKTNFIDSVG